MAFRAFARALLLAALLLGAVQALPQRPRPGLAHAAARTFAAPYYDCPNTMPGNPDPLSNCNTPAWPATSQRFHAAHTGIDFLLRYKPVLAADGGSIEFIGWDHDRCHDEGVPGCTALDAGYGLYVRIRHTQPDPAHPYTTYYGHLSAARNEVVAVAKGEWIGTSGDSGNSGGPHLHFEVRHAGVAVNPDNENGQSLWANGEWSGGNPTFSLAAKRFPQPVAFGAEYIVDDEPVNASPGFTKGCYLDPGCPQFWFQSTSHGYGGDHYWTFDNDHTPDYWAAWRPLLPALPNQNNLGAYEVSAWMPCPPAGAAESLDFRSWKAPYRIYRYAGSNVPVIVDQLTMGRNAYPGDSVRNACNRWLSLGFYLTQSGSSNYAQISDASGEFSEPGFPRVYAIGVDALKFVRVQTDVKQAEAWQVNAARSNAAWQLRSALPGFGGWGYVQALPNAGQLFDTGYAATSPELRYEYVFPAPGNYYLWVYGYGGTDNDDSLHAGLAGNAQASAAGICGCFWRTPGWQWGNARLAGGPAYLHVSTPGIHQVTFWMREDGLSIDRFTFK